MKIVSTSLFILIFGFSIVAQNKYTINGFARDSITGEELIGVVVYVKEIPAIGASTNAYGFYSLTIPEGNYTLATQYLSYKPTVIPINLKENIKLDLALSEQTAQLNEVVVSAEKKDENITNVRMGEEKMEMNEIAKIPVIFGVKDVLKTIQLRPGVKSSGEAGIGFYVRGGGADQNLILLDEATVYNASHLFGFFSVFNSDALKDMTLFKGSQPAEYGGRLSSVLDIKMLDGNDKKFGVEGGLGSILSRLKIEGPIVKEKSSFIISARRTYADLFLKASGDSLMKRTKLYFYDFNLKSNYRINNKNRIFVSAYFGRDVFDLGRIAGFDWGNATGTLRWNHLFNEKIFSNTSLILSNYNYNIHAQAGDLKVKITSTLQDYNLKQDFQYFVNSDNKLKFGFNTIYHKIIPGAIVNENTPSLNEKPINTYDWESALYFSHELKPAKKINLEYGMRFSSFSILGPGTFYTYDKNGDRTDSVKSNSGAFFKTYLNPEPRLAISYILNQKSSVKAAYGRNVQNLHLMSNSNSGSPTDLWIPSSNNVKPGIADQASLGYFKNFLENKYEFSTELYYKKLKNQVDYKDGAELAFSQKVESLLLFGKGRAYGAEFFLKKKYGRLTGWVGYTLSRTERKIEGINKGKYYPAKQDRTHDISIVAIYEFSKKWTFSAAWVYYTGNAVTFPSGKYQIGGQVKFYYTERNGYRMPDYHRLDIGFTWLRKKTSKYELSYTFSLYNAYGRQNAYSITFRQDPNDPSKTQAVQTSLFRWVPSGSMNFKF